MLYYIYISVILILVFLFLFIKIKFKFWSKQPVFNIYNIYYWLLEPGIIKYAVNESSKFLDFQHIKFTYYNKLNEEDKKEFVHHLNTQYLNDKHCKYTPTCNNIDHYFKQTINPIYSFYRLKYTNKLIASITGRQLSVNIKHKKFKCYYVDYLCIHKEYRKRGYAEKMIQTHEYYQRKNTNIKVSLFKKETNLHLIVPLVVYKTYKYDIEFWENNVLLENNIQLIKVTKQNIYNYWKYIKNSSIQHSILCNLSSLINLIDSNNVYIYVLNNKINNDVFAIYFFKDSITTYHEKQIIECTGSICLTKNKQLFIHAFSVLLKDFNKIFKYLFIEDLSDNYLLLKAIQKKHTPIHISTYAYYFYNYAVRPIDKKNILILC